MVATPSSPRSAWTWAISGLVVVAVLARAAVMAGSWSRPADDPDNYLPLARSLAAGRGFVLAGRPTAYRPPLYPLILAPAAAVGEAALLAWFRGLHLVLGGATVALVASAARRFGLTSARALIAAGIVALDPVLVVQARSVMTETLAAFLLAGALQALGDPRARGAFRGGIWLGLSALCRPSTLPAAGLIAASALSLGPGQRSARLARCLALALATAGSLAPWAARNAYALGEPVWTTTHGGYTLALANNPAYYEQVLDGPPGAVWSGPGQRRWQVEISRATTNMTEPQADRFLRRRALELIAARPRDFARAALARLGRFWGLAPSGAVYPAWLRLATAAWTLPLWLAVALGAITPGLWRWPRVAAAAIVLGLTAVHSVYWTDLRMRSPVVPALALIAAGACGPSLWAMASAPPRKSPCPSSLLKN